MTLLTMMEPDNAKETPSLNFAVAATGGDISDRPCGLDHYGQELLAKRSEAGRSWSGQHRAERTA